MCGKKRRREEREQKKAESGERNEPLSAAVLLRDEVVVSQLRLRELLRHRHRFFLFNQCDIGFSLCRRREEVPTPSRYYIFFSTIRQDETLNSSKFKKSSSLFSLQFVRAGVCLFLHLFFGSKSRTKTSRRYIYI